MSKWVDAKTQPPSGSVGYAWVRSNGEGLTTKYDWYDSVELAYNTGSEEYGGRWQKADTVGDSEGLSVERFENVTHYLPLIKPIWNKHD